MEEKEEAEEEVVDEVDKEEEDVDPGILMLVIMMNVKSQASMERWLNFIHRIILNKISGSIYLRM